MPSAGCLRHYNGGIIDVDYRWIDWFHWLIDQWLIELHQAEKWCKINVRTSDVPGWKFTEHVKMLITFIIIWALKNLIN